METPTAFVLNDAIQSWRDGLRRSPHFREGDLTELEAHLRDSVAAWQSRGLMDEEAFLLATRRLGHPAGLEPEFAKINRSEVWLNRLLWMVVGIQVWGLVGTLSSAGTHAAVFGSLAGLGYKFQPLTRASSPWLPETLFPAALLLLTNLLALAGCVAACWWFARRMDNSACKVAMRALRRPVLAGLAITILLLVINGAWIVGGMFLNHCYSPSEIGTIAWARSLAGLILWPLQTTAFVVITILLLRRRFRLSRAS